MHQGGTPALDDAQWTARRWNGAQAYADSKLYDVVLAFAVARRWHEVMTAEYTRLIEASAHGRATLLDQYGATSEAEFFAVATECFFDRPVPLRDQHPRLYELLKEYYHQDPARRVVNSHGD